MLSCEFQDSLIFPAKQSPAVDAGTNTECVFIQPVAGRKNSQTDSVLSRLASASSGGAGASVKRSKTFSPSAPINKSQYNCRVSPEDWDQPQLADGTLLSVEQK